MRTRLPPRKLRPQGQSINIKAVLKDWPFWICVVGAMFIFWGLFFPCESGTETVLCYATALADVLSPFFDFSDARVQSFIYSSLPNYTV